MPNTSPLPISATILVKNGARSIRQTLESLSHFAEVVVLDTGSTDNTLSIVKDFSNASIYHAPFAGFGAAHNFATSLARYDWIFSIDCDEVVSDALLEELCSLSLTTHSVYSVWRKNLYRGKWIKGCGWYPDRVVRLYHREMTQFTDVPVHESVITEGMQHICLKGYLLHHPYYSIDDFFSKMRLYSSLFAKQHQGKKRVYFSTALLHGLAAFLKSYVWKQGLFLGAEGLEISVYNANTAFYKYLFLRDLNEKNNLEKPFTACSNK